MPIAPPPPGRIRALLGAQRFDPTLGPLAASLGVEGRFAQVTAGWQEREPEDRELSSHLGGNTVNLTLHARAESVFARDPDFSAAHRERQDLLRHLQDVYRIRLEHAFDAELDVRTYGAPAAIREEVEASSVEAIRALDAWHLAHCRDVRAEFEARWRPLERPEVAQHREELRRLLADCSAICVAGGHVALLANRMTLFGLDDLVEERAVFAWSAGAMAISERVVLFHDDPPQGRIAREVLDFGLGLVRGVVVLPEPERRLDLAARDRVSLMARRFAPARCVIFPARAALVWRDGRPLSAQGAEALTPEGAHRALTPEDLAS
jgi:hypothetical protein